MKCSLKDLICEEHNGDILLANEKFSLFFTDKKDKILASSSFGLQYMLTTRNGDIYLNFEKRDELFKLLELDILN